MYAHLIYLLDLGKPMRELNVWLRITDHGRVAHVKDKIRE